MKKILALSLICFVSFPGYGEENSLLQRYSTWSRGPSNDPNYFPIAVWLQNPTNASAYKEAGINLYIGLWQGPTEEQLALLKKADMRVICSQNAVGKAHLEDPIIAGWAIDDEPDNAQEIRDPQTGEKKYGPPVPPEKIIQQYQSMKDQDPTRPIFLNLGQGVANEKWVGRGEWGKKEDYFSYVKGCDILSYDIYPIADLRIEDNQNALWYVAKGVQNLIQWSNGSKIVWNCIECTHIGNEQQKATPLQVKAEVWMSIIHGSMGIIYFVHEFAPKFNEHALLDDPEMLESVTLLNRQIHSLAPTLNTSTIPNSTLVHSENSEVPIATMEKVHEGKRYLFSVGMRNEETQVTFTLEKGMVNESVNVLGEDRQIAIQEGKWNDRFLPYEVHIYEF